MTNGAQTAQCPSRAQAPQEFQEPHTIRGQARKLGQRARAAPRVKIAGSMRSFRRAAERSAAVKGGKERKRVKPGSIQRVLKPRCCRTITGGCISSSLKGKAVLCLLATGMVQRSAHTCLSRLSQAQKQGQVHKARERGKGNGVSLHSLEGQTQMVCVQDVLTGTGPGYSWSELPPHRRKPGGMAP